MEFQEILLKRRSVRDYDGTKKVTREQIEEMIKASIYGATWKNFAPQRFYAALSGEAIEKVRAALPDFNVKNTKGATAFLIATAKKGLSGYNEPNGHCLSEYTNNEWGAYDLGLTCGNLINKAADLGLGTLIMGIRNTEKLRRDFNIPEDEMLMAVIAVGYEASEPVLLPRKKLEDIGKFY